MRKLTIIFILLAICCSCVKKDNEKQSVNQEQYFLIKILSHAKVNNIKGNVIEYSETQYLDPYETDTLKGNKTVYKLDSKGNLIEETQAGISTKIKRKQNIEIQTIQNASKIELSWVKTITVAKPDVIVQRLFGKRGKVSSIVKYSLDKKGFVIKKENFGDFYDDGKETYINDEYGKCIEKYSFNLHYNKDLPFFKTVYKYDNNGNVISENHYPLRKDYPASLSDFAYKYTYDDNGNWLKQYFYENGKLLWRIQREYIYN